MKKSGLLWGVLLVTAMLLLTSCGKSGEEPESPSVTPTPTATVSPTPFEEDNPASHVVWAVHFTANISKENQAKVQAFLKEKGIDCRVDFDQRVTCVSSASLVSNSARWHRQV